VTTRFTLKASQYHDSVSLMNVARSLQALPGVDDAALVMGTEANKRLLSVVGTLSPEVQAANPTDLIVMVKGDAAILDQAFVTAEKLLTKRSSPAVPSDGFRPRTLRSAIQTQPDANLVVISVAGAYAVAEAWDALRRKCHVLLFSDNVSLADEIALKDYAVQNGLLLMGPGAGSAIINGAVLGFANVVPRGTVGIVSAAGTGLQEVSVLLARQGVGISQAIGVGGRDLSNDVGGLMMRHALAALQDDDQTEIVVTISKLPSPAVTAKVLQQLAEGSKPAVVVFLEPDSSVSLPADSDNIHLTTTLLAAAWTAAALAQGGTLSDVAVKVSRQEHELQGRAAQLAGDLRPQQRYIRGLFSGGTLCKETMILWGNILGEIWSNVPFDPAFRLADSNRSRQHAAIDLGEEEFTVGRPHPMIDNDLRIRRLLQEARDPEVAVIQLDVVLGYGAHLDPASELAPAIRQAGDIATGEGRNLIIIVALVGTENDPQNRAEQALALESAGAVVMDSNAAASQLGALIVEQRE
jgi:FdrA protein